MRTGHDNAWMDDEHNQMIACNLGADFTSEHEWGIKGINETLGIKGDPKVMGIERYRVHKPKMEKIALIKENKNKAALVCLKYDSDMKYLVEKSLDEYSRSALAFWPKDKELATAWDESSFGIRVQRPVNIKRLERLHKAIESGDAAVWLGGGHVFKNGGLVIGIISAIPEEPKKQMYEAHVDADKLEAAADATGIKQRIDALNKEHADKHTGMMAAYYAPCGYYALRPGWMMKSVLRGYSMETTEIKSKHPIVFWLNPREQQKNQSGWYTVEELEQWIEGKGPVVDDSKEKRSKQ